MKKYPKGLYVSQCKHVDESITSEFSYCFPLGNKHVKGVKVIVDKFLPPLGKIMYYPLNNTHKKEIKHQILMFHYINQQCSICIIPANSNDPNEIKELVYSF
jgi:hypothetical protein